jgi:hypothetical protein
MSKQRRFDYVVRAALDYVDADRQDTICQNFVIRLFLTKKTSALRCPRLRLDFVLAVQRSGRPVHYSAFPLFRFSTLPLLHFVDGRMDGWTDGAGCNCFADAKPLDKVIRRAVRCRFFFHKKKVSLTALRIHFKKEFMKIFENFFEIC